MRNDFFVEGRYFPNSLWAFTFAQIQADRMNRPVEVESVDIDQFRFWHATAQPSNFVRRHLVREGVIAK